MNFVTQYNLIHNDGANADLHPIQSIMPDHFTYLLKSPTSADLYEIFARGVSSST